VRAVVHLRQPCCHRTGPRYLAAIRAAVRAYHAATLPSARNRPRAPVAQDRAGIVSKSKTAGDGSSTKLIARKAPSSHAWPRSCSSSCRRPGSLYGHKSGGRVNSTWFPIRDKEIRTRLVIESLSAALSQCALPKCSTTKAKILRFLMKENVPRSFPFTPGVRIKRETRPDPDVSREGDAFRPSTRQAVSEGNGRRKAVPRNLRFGHRCTDATH